LGGTVGAVLSCGAEEPPEAAAAGVDVAPADTEFAAVVSASFLGTGGGGRVICRRFSLTALVSGGCSLGLLGVSSAAGTN
jgi:hypothetical protein